MEQSKENKQFGEDFIGWEVLEYEHHGRGKSWYIKAGIVGGLMLLYAFWTANFLFALIIIIGGMIIIINDGRGDKRVSVALNGEGVYWGSRFYDYDEFKNFSIVYKPREGIKNLYFEFRSAIKQRVSIPLENINPLVVREFLLQYLEEDLERVDQPLSEGLARLFKL